MHHKKRQLGAIALAAATAVALAITGSGAANAASPSTFVIVTAAQPQSFAADLSATGYEAAEFFLNTGATLIRNKYVSSKGGAKVEDYNAFTGVLAKSYSVSPDGLTYTFHLNTKAKSTSGNPLTAQDVVWSMERHFNTPTAIVGFISAPFITKPDQFKAVNNSTVTLTVAQKSYGYSALSLLANVPYDIYDYKYLKSHVTAKDPYAVKWSGTHANFGFGAYKLSSYTPGEQMVYTANPGYTLGEPPVKRIVQRVVADPGTRANLLKTGNAQVGVQLRPADQVSLSKAKSAKIYTIPSDAYVYMPLLTTSGPFKDLQVRKALAAAIPYAAINKNVYHGRATPISTIIPTSTPGYDGTDLHANKEDPAEAQSILNAAGYTAPVKFTLTVNNTVPDLDEAAVTIQTAVDKAGFDMTINQVNSSAFQSGLSAKSFDASLQRDYADIQAPPYILSLFYTPGSPVNWPDWNDPDYQAALAAGNAAEGSPASAAAGKQWNAAQQLLQSQMPTIYINYVQPLNAFANDVKGYVFRSDNVLDYSQFSVKK